MPMRIIGRGRDSYVLAGYLNKRGKWTRQWSERYFVLTDKVLYWFKKERGQIFGEERGQWDIDDIQCTELTDKLCIKVQCNSRHDTTLLKANSEHEYTIWCNALRDVVLNHSTGSHKRNHSDDLQQSQKHEPHSDNYISEPDTPVATKQHTTTETNTGKYTLHTPTINAIPSNIRQVSDSNLIMSPRNSDMSSNEQATNTTVTRPNRSYSRVRDSTAMPPPTSPVVRNRATRSQSTVGDVVDPLLIVLIEKFDNNTVIQPQMRPALFSTKKPSLNAVRRGNILLGSGGTELVVARNVPWSQTIHVPNFTHNDILYGVLGDGSRVKVKHNELINSSGEKLFSIDDPYRSADVLIRWQRVKPNYSVLQAINYSTFIVLPLIYISLLLLYTITNYDSTVYSDFNALLDTVFSTQGALRFIGICNACYAGTDAIRRANGNRQQRMWLFTFVSLHESLMPKQGTTENTSNTSQTTNTDKPTFNNKNLLSVVADSNLITPASEMRSPHGIFKRPPVSPTSKQVQPTTKHSPHKLSIPKQANSIYSDSEPHSAGIQHNKNQSSRPIANSSVLVPHSPSSNIQPRGSTMKANSNTTELNSDDTLDDDDTYTNAVRNGTIDLDATDVEYEPYETSDTVAKRQSVITTVSVDHSNIQYTALDEYMKRVQSYELQTIQYYQTSSLPPITPAVWGSWTEPDLSVISVRGKTFTDDKRKIAAGLSMFKLLHVDMFYSTTEKLTRIANRSDNYVYQYYNKHKSDMLDPTTDEGKLNPLFIINFVYPGPEGRTMTITCYYVRQIRTATMLKQSVANNEPIENTDLVDIERIAAYDKLLLDFLTGTDEYRNNRFKIIARIAEGSWVVKKGVGATPAILGRKISQSYYYDTQRNIFELDVDVGSSMVAGKILSLVKSAALSLTIDMTFILQGETYDELPEQVMCGVRVANVDLMKIQTVEQNSQTYTI